MAGTSLASFVAFRPTNEELVALLPSLFAGAGSPFVHHADVLSAAPAVLVGNLAAAPGTDKGDGHGGVWYLLCPKKSKSDGDERRMRTVAGGGCWRGEAKNKVEVVLSDSRRIAGSFHTFSYGYKTPAKQFKRLGWCMVEYELEGEGYDDHVLCKVYRSPRAKASSSNSNSAAVLPSARLSADKVQETGLTHDAPMMPVQVQYGAGLNSYPQEGLQPGTCGPVYGADTFPFVIGGYEENLPTQGALMVSAAVQHSAGGQVLDGYVVAEGPELGYGMVHGGGIDDVEELLAQLDQAGYDPLVSHLAGATFGTPPDDHFFDGLPF